MEEDVLILLGVAFNLNLPLLTAWQHSSRGAGRNGQGFSPLLPVFTSTRSMSR